MARSRSVVTPLDEVARRLVRRSRREQGLPPRIVDPSAIAAVATLIRDNVPSSRKKAQR